MIEKEVPIPTTRTMQSRTCYMYIDTKENTDYTIRAVRQDKYFEDTVQTDEKYHELTRPMSAIIDQTVTLHDNTVLSAAQIAEGLQLFIDRWDTEVWPPVQDGPPE